MKKSFFVCLLIMVIMVLMACGDFSGEQVKEVQMLYAQVVDSHNAVVELYADFEDEILTKELDVMAEEIKYMGMQDTKKMTKEERILIWEQLKSYLVRYNEMKLYISELAVRQQEQKETKEFAITITFLNNTGIDLYQLYLYNVSSNDKGENFAEDIVCFASYETRNVLNFFMSKDDCCCIIEAFDEGGKQIIYSEIDFSNCQEEVTIDMNYNFDDMEGWIVLK